MTMQGKFETRALRSVTLDGTVLDGESVLIYDKSRDKVYVTGSTVPTDDTAGYAKGCLFVDLDVVKGTTGLYVNVGTNTECTFKAVSNAA